MFPVLVIELGNNYYGGPQKSQFQWTTLYNNPGWFNVWVSDAGMAGKTLGLGKDYCKKSKEEKFVFEHFGITQMEMPTVTEPSWTAVRRQGKAGIVYG
jgi:hypothetical protein